MQMPGAARTALDTWLKVARLPFDTAAKVLFPGEDALGQQMRVVLGGLHR